MAVSTINPWSAGAVVFNELPYMQFYQQQMAKKQAKQDALDNYFRDLGKNITPAGMRNQDISGLTKRTNEWQQFYQQNKQAILNPRLDNGDAYSQYMSRYNDQLAYIDKSKNRLKTDDELNKVRLDPTKSYILDDPDLLDHISKHQLPIDDPNSKELNIAEMSLAPKPIDTKEKEAHRKYLTGGLKADEIYGTTQNLPGFKTLTPVTTQYSQKNKEIIGQRAMDVYDTDRSWRIESSKLFDKMTHDPILHNQLNSTFKSVYGKDIETPREARAAQDILDNDVKSIEYKPGENVFGREKVMAGIRHGYAEDEIRLRDALKNQSEGEQDNTMDNLYMGLKEDAAKNKQTYKLGTGSSVDQYEMKPTETTKKLFAIHNEKGHLVYPDIIRFSKDFKNVHGIFLEHYGEDEEGHTPSEIKKDKSGQAKVTHTETILEPEFKERWKKEIMGAGAYGKSLKGKSKTITKSYSMDGKVYTHKQLNDMGYDDNEINQAINAGIIK